MSSVEIHIPISPRSSFFTMVHFFAASLRRRGGAFRDARIIVSVGEDCEPFDIERSRPELARYGISWRWTDRNAFRDLSYFANALHRWGDFESDYVVMADADTLVLGDISESLRWLSGPFSMCAVTASCPPSMARGGGNTDAERWPELFRLAKLPVPLFDLVHPGYGRLYDASEGMREAPPYFDFGFVLGTAKAMSEIAKSIKSDYRVAVAYMKTDLASQAALTLSIVRNHVAYAALPVKFNMRSRRTYVQAFPEDFAEARLLHYNASEVFAKTSDIESLTAVKNWLTLHEQSTEPMTALIADGFRSVIHDVEDDWKAAREP